MEEPINKEMSHPFWVSYRKIANEKISQKMTFSFSKEHSMPPVLLEEQANAIQIVRRGQSIFLTGPPGTGKSFTITYMVKVLRGMQKNVGVTAMTGAAAVLLNGRTLHGFLGIGLGKGTADALAHFVKTKNRRTYKRLRELHVLIIDEVSMLDAELFAKVSRMLSILRQDDRPFGGITMVLAGDAAQLPPISGEFWFQHPEWHRMTIETVRLRTIVRQKEDPEFMEMLGELRWGNMTEEIYEKLKTRLIERGAEGSGSEEGHKDPNLEISDGSEHSERSVKPTRLYSKNVDVDAINEAYMEGLPGEKMRYPIRYRKIFTETIEKYARSAAIPAEFIGCAGAQVVLTYNLDVEAKLVNGSRGVILEVRPDIVMVRFRSGIVRGITYRVQNLDEEDLREDAPRFEYIPLRLAFALSIHRSQGMTLDSLEIDLGESIFAYGQAYVALSRARTLDSVRLVALHRDAFRCHPVVKEFYGV